MMKRLLRSTFVAAAILFLSVWVIHSMASSGFSIPWQTIDGGGGQSSTSDYTLSGSIGQSDAGEMAGGAYALRGGFWSLSQPAASPSPTPTATPEPPTDDLRIHLPAILNGAP